MKPIIEFCNVCYSYASTPNGISAVEDVSFQIRTGEFVAIIGNNGAGKTTVSKLMNGLLKPTRGTVLIDGASTDVVSTSALARRVGMLFQNPDHQICQPTAFDEIAFTLRLQGRSEEDVAMLTKRMLAEFDIDGQADPFTLSRSDRQYLALASVIAAEPDVLILDEPTNGLDGRACRRVMRRVQDLQRQGCAIVMITHDMELAFDTAQRLLVMADGHLVAQGGPETVFRNDRAMEAASVLPPQIIDVSQRLAAEGGDARLFAHAASVYEVLSVMKAAGLNHKLSARRGDENEMQRKMTTEESPRETCGSRSSKDEEGAPA